MAPELFDAWEDENIPAKTLASDCYALGQAIVEVRSPHTCDSNDGDGKRRK
jgi:hypothetical protein